MESLTQTVPKTPSQEGRARSSRIGRWSPAESDLFESLLERYGKNWRKIHKHMKGRTLSQIRSHAQKFFEKIGPNRVEQF